MAETPAKTVPARLLANRLPDYESIPSYTAFVLDIQRSSQDLSTQSSMPFRTCHTIRIIHYFLKLFNCVRYLVPKSFYLESTLPPD